jgi:single-stranded DNA-binding protein
MNANLVLLRGRLASAPEHRTLDSGSRLVRLLVAVRAEEPHGRLDVLPVVYWEPGDEFMSSRPVVGGPIQIAGSIHRRFWDSADGRRSKIEVVASCVSTRSDDETA